LRPETNHVTVRVNNNNNNNNNNYAAVCKEDCELTSLSNAVTSHDKRMNVSNPEDSRDELINSLSVSDCILSDKRWGELIID